MQTGMAHGRLMFLRNFKEYPQSSNVYPSLAGGLYARWKNSLAIENYEGSVQLDLQNKNGSGTLFSNFETSEKLESGRKKFSLEAPSFRSSPPAAISSIP